jgi:lactate permease
MFSFFQFGVAERLLMPTTFMVALQAVGAAAGNMIAIHNVVAASATVGYLGQEGLIYNICGFNGFICHELYGSL